MTLASSMILIGSLLTLALAGYWMRRAAKAEQRVDALCALQRSTIKHYEQEAAEANEARKRANRLAVDWMARARRRGVLAHSAGYDAAECRDRLHRIISLETPNMAHVGKKAVAIAKGER